MGRDSEVVYDNLGEGGAVTKKVGNPCLMFQNITIADAVGLLNQLFFSNYSKVILP